MAGLSQGSVSRVELGRLSRLSVASLRGLARALDADLVLTVRWRAGDLDRLLDEGHAALLGRTADLLVRFGWSVVPEVTFAVYGERGSIDLLALHPKMATLLVIEIKTELVSVEETLRRHDTKVRLAPRLALERLGWKSRSVSRLLVLPDTSTARRRVRRAVNIPTRTNTTR